MKKINNEKRLRYMVIILLILIVVIKIAELLKPDPKAILAKDGVFDLNAWKASDGVINLNGQWDFYWEHFLTYEEAVTNTTKPDLLLNMPSNWNGTIIDGKKISSFGYATYLLQIVNAPVGKPLVIWMPTTLTAYDLYIDDRLVVSSGKVGINEEMSIAGCKPQEMEFTPTTHNFKIMIHASNFASIQGGVAYSIKLGTPEYFSHRNKEVSDLDLLLFGALIVMGFYYLNNFINQRVGRANLYIAVTFFIWTIMTTISGDFFIYRLIPNISAETIIKIYYIGISWSSVLSVVILDDYYPRERNKKPLRVFTVYASLMTLVILLTPMTFYSHLNNIIVINALLIGAYGLYIVMSAFLRGEKDSICLLIAGLTDLICAADDMLFQNNMSKWGTLILLFMQTYVLSRRFSEAYWEVNDLSLKLLRLDKTKDEFLANTSHELRTPLSGIQGITEAMLKGSDGELNNKQRANLSIIAASSRRLSNLVNDILDYSKMKNGEITINIKLVKIDRLINTVVTIFKQLHMTKDCEVIFDNSEELPLVLGDENRILQILYNLIGNAVKFTEKGSVRILARQSGEVLEVCITDNGEGIPEDKLEDIFKSFEQVDNSETRRHGGTGLGLSITKHLVELQGGSIWVESRLGEGSKFYFTLPLSHEKQEKIDGEGYEYELSVDYSEDLLEVLEPTLGEERILLVDDDIVNLKAASSLLKLEGYGITTAISGQTALDILEKNTDFALVILDVMMPVMSGYEVCIKIRETKSRYELPILMLTARSSVKDIVRGFEVGGNDYLSKPFEADELLARVRTLTVYKSSVDRAIAAEYAFLQAQIKPHFLFNTLNTISSFCDTDPKLAQQLIDNYAGYLRETFDFKTIELCQPIEKELYLVKLYVEIEKARFGDELIVIFDVDSSIKVKIPKLSIQPLVENAIEHGLRKKSGKGIVTICVKRVPQGVQVAVKDDGQGMSADKLKTLLTDETGTGIGLWNIDKRLQKLYKKGIIIESAQGIGTKVSYVITSEVIEND